MNYKIRLAKKEDVIECRKLADFANELMLSRGNPQQSCGYPQIEILYNDVELNRLYVAEDEGEIVAMVVIQKELDETYERYHFWTEGPYLSVHRIVSKRSGLGRYLIQMAIDEAKKMGINVRLDTHVKNINMRKLVESLGFIYVGETEQNYIDETLALTYELVL